MFRGTKNQKNWSISLALILFCAMAETALADSIRHRAEKTKNAAPTQEDHAAYFSTLETATPEKMKQADKLRQKTISSVEKLLKDKKTNKVRAFELYLRLGELHAERSDFLRSVEVEEWEAKHDEWKKNGMKGKEPQLDTKDSQAELLKSTSAFRTLVTTYPNDNRTDAALFSLAKTLGRMGNENAVLYFNQLIKNHPNSRFIPSAYLALGEYYFDQHNIPMAMQNYKAAMKFKDDRVYPYAVYKLGWSHFNSAVKDEKQYAENTEKALAAFKLVVRLTETKNQEFGRMNLKQEAIKDLVMVWAETERIQEAWEYFSRRNEKEAFYDVLERLGNIYVEQGKNKNAVDIFTRLLREAPTRPNNPNIYVKLVKINDEEGNIEGVVENLTAMNRLYAKNSTWTTSNAKDAETVKSATETTERNTHRYGALFHSRGQKQKKDDYLKASAKIYQLYLASFPKNENVYEIRYYLADILYYFKQFEEASAEYTKVANERPKDGKYLKDSALNAVVAINDLDGAQKYAKLPPAGKVEKPIELPRVKEKLVAVIDNFVRLLPKDPAGHPMRFTAAQTYFEYGHYEEAIKRFEKIGYEIPETKQGKLAIKIILTYHAEKKNWNAVVTSSRRYLQSEKLVAGGLKETITDALKNGVFQRALELEKEKQHDKAAQMFLAYQKEFSDDKNSDRALFNASLNFYKIAKVDEALDAGNLLLKTYPKSELIPNVALNMAQTYESLADFENAAKYYRDFATRYPDDKNASGALYNAATLFKGLNKFDASEKLYERFIASYPKHEAYPDALKELAMLNERKKNFDQAVRYWDRYAQAAASDVDQSLHAKAKVAQIHYVYGDKNKGDKELRSLQRLLTAKNGPNAFEARHIIAELMFNELEAGYSKFREIKVKSADSIQKDVKNKQSRLVDLAGQYERLIEIGNGEYTVAALYRLGEMHENFANELFNAPAPQKANQVELDQYRSSIEKVAFPLKEESMKFYEAAYKRSIEVQTFSEWTKRAYDKMNEISPEKHPTVIEKSTDPAYMSHKMEWEDSIKNLTE